VTAEIDYVGVREFVALILAQRWEPRGANEYIRLSMMPGLLPPLPAGILLDRTYGFDPDGMMDVRLKRLRGWRL
jgi:hypothetical protein